MTESRFIIDGNNIVMTMSLDTLAAATESSPAFNEVAFDATINDWRKVTITDKLKWAEAVLHELSVEQEDGTTMVHRLFDAAFMRAFEQGAEGVSIPGVTEDILA